MYYNKVVCGDSKIAIQIVNKFQEYTQVLEFKYSIDTLELKIPFDDNAFGVVSAVSHEFPRFWFYSEVI